MAWTEVYPFTNADLEDGDKEQPWIPDSWTVGGSNSMWEYAAFDTYAAGGWESFESGWGRDDAWPTDNTARGWRHITADRTDMSSFNISDQDNCETTANELKVIANAHFGDTDFHTIADPRTITASDATDLASLITLCIELHDDTVAHATDATPTWHNFKGYGGWDYNILNSGTPADLADCKNMLLDVILSFGRHLWWRGPRIQWTEFRVATAMLLVPWVQESTIDADESVCAIEAKFDDADGYDSEEYEDFEEGHTSSYLDGAAQTALGSNESWSASMDPGAESFSHGDDFDSYEEAWGEPRHKAPDESLPDNTYHCGDLPNCLVTANALKVIANNHFGSTVYHTGADARTIAASAATDLSTLAALVNELHLDGKAHAEDAGLDWHLTVTDTRDVPDSGEYPAGAVLAECQSVLQAVHRFFGRHLRWKGNELGATEFLVNLEITYSTEFGSAWTMIDIGAFDVASDYFEDFEEEWSDNEDYLTAFTIPTNLTLFSLFDSSSAETFDYQRPFTSVSTTPGNVSDTLTLDPEKSSYFIVTGSGTWTYILQLRVNTGGNWIDWLTYDTTLEYEIPTGYKEARVKCSAYSSGTMTPKLHWERQEVY